LNTDRITKAMTDYRRHAEGDNRSLPYATALVAILGTLLMLAESLTWLVTGRDEYWLLSRWIFAPIAKAGQAYPWITILIGCLALICAVAVWAFRSVRSGSPLAKALDEDPEAQASWLRNTPR